MPRKKNFAWSYSALDSYETCPKKHYHTRIKKDFVEKPGKAMMDGKRVHSAFESRLKHGSRLPSDLIGFEPLCRKMEQIPGVPHIEFKVALTRDLKPVGFFDRDVWVRGVFDYAHTRGKEARIIDYKTGKRRPDSDQLMLFAALGFAVFPEVERIGTAFWWLKDKTTDRGEYVRSKQDIIWREFEPRVERMEASFDTDDWPARPSGLCRGWCPVRDCEHWEERD